MDLISALNVNSFLKLHIQDLGVTHILAVTACGSLKVNKAILIQNFYIYKKKLCNPCVLVQSTGSCYLELKSSAYAYVENCF
jgi:hypothetical protein